MLVTLAERLMEWGRIAEGRLGLRRKRHLRLVVGGLPATSRAAERRPAAYRDHERRRRLQDRDHPLRLVATANASAAAHHGRSFPHELSCG
jgi:hypothetical protein